MQYRSRAYSPPITIDKPAADELLTTTRRVRKRPHLTRRVPMSPVTTMTSSGCPPPLPDGDPCKHVMPEVRDGASHLSEILDQVSELLGVAPEWTRTALSPMVHHDGWGSH